jgi:glycine/D-amino acid oxidase-like deaminating enzyme
MTASPSKKAADVIVIGAGAVGAATAYFAARAGLSVLVLDSGAIAGGTSSACEGNLLVSDKEAGPELDLSLYSQKVWREDLAEFSDLWEFDSKGGLVVAASEQSAQSLHNLTLRQRASGIQVSNVSGEDLRDYEPHISKEMTAGAFYPEDAQVQPMLVVAHLLRLARELGATVKTHTPVTGLLRTGAAVSGVTTPHGNFSAPSIVNAAGTWAGGIADLAGVHVPVLPRRGFVLVTEPLPLTIHHKVYAAEYVDNVASSDAGLQTSPVVEGTESGTVLIGSSRERVGFDRGVSLPALMALATSAINLFPVLADVKAIRHYHGFRPYCPDHLPVIGPDPRAPGLWHAAGHEGAGIGLSVGTGKLIAQSIAGTGTDIPLTSFAPERFEWVLT